MAEQDFVKLVGDLDESISGTDSSSSEEEEDQQTTDSLLPALLKKQARISRRKEDEEFFGTKAKRGSGGSPMFWLSSSLFSTNISLGIYKAMFSVEEQEEEGHVIETLRNKQLKPHERSRKTDKQAAQAPPSPHIFLCMIGGGHFAAMIVELAPDITRKANGAVERSARVLAHKTFHRYTTRRKQGGSQSASDAANGAAHSAGSSLRRYNEVALENDIRNLLAEWKGMIDTSQLLFVRATGNTNRRVLFGPYDGQVLRHNDPRIRGFPFSTRRATQAELMRSFSELTRIKVSEIDEAALAAAAAGAEAAEKADAAKKAQQNAKKQVVDQLSKADEEALLHTTQIQALVKRSRAPALLSYLTNNNLSADFSLYSPPDAAQKSKAKQSLSLNTQHTPTCLHLAASTNSAAIVIALLVKANANPTIQNSQGKVPAQLAGDRQTRNAFRTARHDLGEEKWNWEAALVGDPVSKEEVDKEEEAKKKADAAAEAERRKTELEKIRAKEKEAEEASQKKKNKGGRALGAAVLEKTAAEKREEESRGMTPEMRMKLERERRARAAEERMRRMAGGR